MLFWNNRRYYGNNCHNGNTYAAPEKSDKIEEKITKPKTIQHKWSSFPCGYIRSTMNGRFLYIRVLNPWSQPSQLSIV